MTLLSIHDPTLEAIRTTAQPVWAYDTERNRLTWANAAGLAFWSAADLTALAAVDVDTSMPPEARRQLSAYFHAVRDGGEIEEQLTLCPKGEPVTLVCRCRGVRIDENSAAVLVEGRVQVIEAATLRAVEALNSTEVMFSLLDFEGQVRFENPAALAAHGYKLRDEVRNAFEARFVDLEPARDAWAGLLQDISYEGQLRVLTRRGERLHDVSARTTTDPVTGERVVLVKETDITEQRRIEQRMQLTDRMASIGELAGGLAHEINNPLAYVMMNLELLEEMTSDGMAAADPTELETILQDLREGADRIRSTVHDLGELASVDGGERSPTSVEAVLETSIAMTHSRLKTRARLVRDFAEVPFVSARRSRLGQVFVNVLVNAAQAIEPGAVEQNEVTLSTRVSDCGERVIVEIADTGHGVEPANLQTIFNPFYTTRPAGIGTGLGLSVARHIVTEQGGEIFARPNGRRGLVLRVELPAATEDMLNQTSTLPPMVQGIRRVLVVDDEPGIRRAIARVLNDHHIDTASSGAEALAKLEADEYDVIFCDIMMPVMDGIALYDRLVALGNGVERSIVFITAGAFTERTSQFLERVPNTSVQKPFNRDVLRAIVTRM